MSKPSKKPPFTWRALVTGMKPDSRYSFEMLKTVLANQIPDNGHPTTEQTRLAYESAGQYIQWNQHDGSYALTDIGIRFREKELQSQQ